MNRSNFIHIISLLSITCVFLLSSCVPWEKMLLLKNMEMADSLKSIEYRNERSLDYKIQPGDNLFIRVINIVDDKSLGSLNNENSRVYSSSEASIYLNSHTVNKEGYIEYPLAGLVYVKNLTVEQAKDKIQEALSVYVKETSVIVKLANFDLTILGEVHKPGKYKVYQSEINILEAIAMAGDKTNFAKTESVKLVRYTDNGSEIVTVNLGDADILSSPYYFLKPNDIVYIEPLKIKQWGFTTFPYSTVLSIISMGITIFTLVYKLK